MYSQLGLGETSQVNTLTKLMTDKRLKTVCCGVFQTLLLLDDGQLLVQGFGSGASFRERRVLMKDKTIKRIACGDSYCLVERGEGEILLLRVDITNPNRNLVVEKTLLEKANVAILLQGKFWAFEEWTPQNHSKFPKSFKERVINTLLCLKTKNIRVPKYVLFIIFKQSK